ncbi:DUF5518 domain-containing protein [Halosolutus amylolyticus]|uniref:DUF5518 domain-containing protein n=1 Tax=Halosolutus amylolyticus TaxID=2932267 RepID=A0ABD5PJW2_9EURY|nr:DUF5518 domain-containing protein [Halosolutus amylolyticus]
MTTERTVINAIIGAVIGVVLSFIPFSTVVGGAVAGFLEGPNPREGAIVGALAGVITFLPIAGIAVIALGVLGFGMGVAAAPIEGFAVATVVVLVFASIVFLYTVGLSLLGGYLGAYLAMEYPDQRTRTRDTIGLSRTDRSRRDRSGPIDPTRPPGPAGDGSLDRDREEDQPQETDAAFDADRDTERERS